MKRNKMLSSSAMTILAVVFTILVKTVDVGYVANTGSAVGFYSVNMPFIEKFSFNATLFSLTQVLGLVALLPVIFFAFLGLYELATRKSLKKVDPDLYAMALLYVLMAAVYIFFDKVYVVNLRPIIMEGESAAASSFPSTHTLLAVTILGSAIMECGRIKSKGGRVTLSLLLALLLLAVVAGRLFSGVHWPTDIIGGVLWGEVLLLWFQYFSLLFSEKIKG